MNRSCSGGVAHGDWEWSAFEFRYLDLATFASVRGFAKKYNSDRLRMCLYSAGVQGVGE